MPQPILRARISSAEPLSSVRPSLYSYENAIITSKTGGVLSGIGMEIVRIA